MQFKKIIPMHVFLRIKMLQLKILFDPTENSVNVSEKVIF